MVVKSQHQTNVGLRKHTHHSNKKILYLHYTRVITPEEWNEWRGPYPRPSTWATQLRRTVAAVATLRQIRPARD